LFKTFESASVKAVPLAAIKACLADDEAEPMDKNDQPEIKTPKIVAVHPWLLALFIRGWGLWDALNIVCALCHTVPDEVKGEMEPLLQVKWIRAGAAYSVCDDMFTHSDIIG
jgi:hypothetical protein